MGEGNTGQESLKRGVRLAYGQNVVAGLVLIGEKPERPRWKQVLLWSAFGLIGLVNAGVFAAAALYVYYARDVPSVSWARDYRPPIVSEVWSGDDQLIGEFYIERRRVAPYERIPRKLVQAFIAAEDDRFFEHSGIDFTGIARAAATNLARGRIAGGGSTLTQQTAKAILITLEGYGQGTEKSLRRKVREAILARRLDASLTKEQVLWLYLNHVNLGHHSYGVQAASENYFRKNVWELGLPEMALLAGLAQAPSRYNPFIATGKAVKRRRYVLRRMLEEGMITKAEHDAAVDAKVEVFPVEDVFRETAPFFTEHARRDVVDRYGNDRLLNDGLRVYATVNLESERDAMVSMIAGIPEVDKRQGFRGPLLELGPSSDGKWPAFLKALQAHLGPGDLATDRIVPALVTKLDRKDGKFVEIAVGERTGRIPLEQMLWARKPNPEEWYPTSLIKDVRGVVKPGDVVLARFTGEKLKEEQPKPKSKKKKQPPPVEWDIYALEQEPKLEGALIAMDPTSGYVVAMIGGYDFNKSEFNRAFQACRQPGSAFKPVIYSAAFEKLGYTASTMLLDAPIVYDDPDNEKRWKPKNSTEEFKGDVLLRTAVINSMNIPAVKTLQAVGPRTAAEWARKLGITSKINEDLSMALGSSCVTPWELTNVYALFNRMGKRPRGIFVRRVLDRDGRTLEDHSVYYDPWMELSARIASGYARLFEEPEQVIEPQTAFLMTQLMSEVVQHGTGMRAKALEKPVAGKTGTTDDSFDAWFLGFTRDLVTGVWVGFDTYETPMARYEMGGHTALPIWVDFMKRVLKDRPQDDFPQPPGIIWVNIDPESGKIAGPHTAEPALEAFREGTEPLEVEGEEGAPSPSEGFIRDGL
jgi:penicillin-binding protein 1A